MMPQSIGFYLMRIIWICLVLFFFAGCSISPKTESVALPGFKWSDGDLFFVINEAKGFPKLTENFPTELQSAFQASEIFYNRYPILNAVPMDSIFARCSDNGAVTTIHVSSTTRGREDYNPTALTEAEYLFTTYRCTDQKTVWKVAITFDPMYNRTKQVIQEFIKKGKKEGIIK